MYDRSKELLEALRATPTVLEGLLCRVTQEQAQAARGGDEGWSVVEVLCHLRDNEERALERSRAMCDEHDPIIVGYDQEQWARERAYARADLREALTAFTGFRARHVEVLAGLTAPEWERTGRHETEGGITISSYALHVVSHDAVHNAQIARQLQT